MMKFFKIAGIFASLALVAACASTGPDLDASAGADTTTSAAPTGPVPGSQADLEDVANFIRSTKWKLAEEEGSTMSTWLELYSIYRIRMPKPR